MKYSPNNFKYLTLHITPHCSIYEFWREAISVSVPFYPDPTEYIYTENFNSVVIFIVKL